MIKTLESKYICSICPIPVKTIQLPYGQEERTHGGRNTAFSLPPVKRGDKPFVLEITDMFENIPDPMNVNVRGQCGQASRIVECEHIARDLVRQWTGSMQYHGRYGIGIIAGPVPTAEEMADLISVQTACFEEIFHEAELLARENKFKHIKKCHRVVGEYLARPRSWWSGDIAANVSQCPACFGDIDARASMCKHCGLKIRELPSEIAQLNKPAMPEPKFSMSVYDAPPEPTFDEPEKELVGAAAGKNSAPSKPFPSIPIPRGK